MTAAVTFTTSAGTRITCPPELAKRLGHVAEEPKSRPKGATSKTEK